MGAQWVRAKTRERGRRVSSGSAAGSGGTSCSISTVNEGVSLEKSPRFVLQEQVQELLEKLYESIGALEALNREDLLITSSVLEDIFPVVAEAIRTCGEVLDTHLLGGTSISGLMVLDGLREMWKNVVNACEYPAERGAV
jgi:hypothetical protein